MKNISWQVILGILLVILSALLYLLHYTIFHDAEHIFVFLLGDIAFLPVEVLFVTLILHRLLAHREKIRMLKKLNMVIGAFFSEVGSHLLKKLVLADVDTGFIRNSLMIDTDWNQGNFKNAIFAIKKYDFDLEIRPEQIAQIKQFLVKKRNFMLRLLENPNLLEHELFTELLWAVFHMTEELTARESITEELQADFKHIVIDLQRIYRLLTLEWIAYMQHLSNDYPYLYSFAIRTNPFNPEASPEIR